ncbi:MAG: biotin synthase auxiliary protein BsaP [Acidimicrobiales bacterium]
MSHCTGCGQLSGDCPNRGRCTTAFEPPRYCAACGRRLAVRVTPTAWVARCRDHGELPAGGTGPRSAASHTGPSTDCG